MLTRQGVINESAHFEAIPINLVATEDGRTLLAVTEHKDGVLEIVATPVTFISQSGSSTSLVDPVFQINVEDFANESELQQSTQHFEAEPNNIDRTKVHSILELKCKKAGDREEQAVLSTDTPINEICDGSVGQKVMTESTKAKNLGRPKKGSAVFSQSTEQLICDICHLEFVKQTTYRKHMENHAEEKPHRCPKCAASFNVPTNFTLHMATHNTGEPKCPECGRKFARMASLKSHILLHEKEENLFCTECEDGFSTKAQLDVHLKLHGEKWTTEEIRKCKLCNKQFTQPALYRLHIREHYKLQTKIVKQTKKGIKHRTMYKCTICLKTFQKPSQLMRHIRVHTGEKPFKCTVCGRAFTQKSSLQIHTWQHNGIRPHACELCNARFSQKGNLNAHIMRVHNVPEGEPIYGCTYCSCVFKKLGSLNGHMKRMHTDVINEEPVAVDDSQSDTTESNIRATVDSVITELASLESNTGDTVKSSNFESVTLSQNMTKKDILQQALKNIGLSNKTKNVLEGTFEQKRLEARTNLVTLLDRAPDGGTRKYLTIRQRCVGNIRWYACNFCHKEFKKPSDLIRHLRVHTQEKPFKCTYCYRSFALKSTMIAHERTHSSNKRYACDSCDKTFACHGSLIVHTRLHRKSCEHSEKSIDNDKMTNAHNTNNTANTCVTSQRRVQAKGKTKLSAEAENLIPQVVLQEPLVISDAGNKICVAQIPSKEKRSHDTTADPARPHKCRICQAAFRKVSHLKQHHRRHTGERPYKCTKCDRRFTSNSVLKSHLHTHEDSRPFGCSICNAKFSTQSSMKRHLVTHSNRRPFMCPYCHKTFKTYVNCRKHMKIHKHELAQRQFEEQKLRVQEHGVETLNLTESSTENPTSESAYRPSVLVTPIASTSTSSIPVTTTPTSIVSSNNAATSSTTYSDNLALSRIGSVEISFQPQLGSEFSQLQAEFQGISGEKQKVRSTLSGNCDAATFINQDESEITVTNLEDAQVLHADEGNSVTLPVYTGDHALTAESIREIEETLNQQFFNIDMNINLESTARHSHGANTVGFDSTKEQQPILSVIYENNNSNNSNSAEPSGQHVFTSQLDSFEMDHIALQSDADIDIGLHTSHSTSMASMASILPRRVKEEHRLSVSLTTSNNVNTDVCERNNMQTVVFVSQHNFSEKENTENELRIGDAHKSTIEEQCVNNPIFLTDEYRETSGDMQQHPNAPATDVEKMIKTPLSKIPQEESLLECHMCSQQGFTTVGLKEHLSCHRGIKEYQCTECFSRFCTNGGLNRHLKMHVARESLKCPLCERCFNDRIQLRSHNKIHETGLWNTLSPRVNNVVENSAISSEMQPVINGTSSLNDIVIDSDASVSQKVLLDTVAEKEIMDRVQNVLVDRTERKEYTNKCKYCPKTFRKPSDLIRHIRTHTGERPYKCDYCNKSFAVKCTLDSHTKVHTGKKTFRCHVCNSLFATKGSLKVHMRLHTGSKPFRCQICDSRFRTSGHRKVHLLKHAREYKDTPKRRQKHSKIAAVAEVAAGLEKCDDNQERTSGYEPEHLQREDFSEIATGYTHLETISIDKNASCLSDPINFDADEIVSNNDQTMLSMNESNQLVTNLHFLLANGLVTIQSEESLLAQSQMSVTNSHQRSSIIPDSENLHITQNESTDIGDNETEGETVHVDQMLKAQPAILTVTGSSTQPSPLTKISVENSSSVMPNKPVIKGNSSKECDICGKIFSKPYQVERHKRIHTGERPYKCDLCTKSFAQKSTLQMHQKHHTGDRPYACLYCEYSFTQKGNLRTHVKRVHQLDTVDLKKRKCVGQTFLTRTSPHENVIETKSPSMEDISFVEFLKE